MVPTQSLEPVAILTGPTATGKSGIALKWALDQGDVEIVNADSLLVYRGMDIGTAKPSPEELRQVPHHLIDIRDPNESFTAGDFHKLAWEAIGDIHARGKRALVVGGTGFYLKALLYGLWPAPKTDPEFRKELELRSSADLYEELHQVDPQSALRIGVNDRYRLVRSLEMIRLGGKTPSELRETEPKTPDPRFELWVIDRENEELETRIRIRTRQMIERGLLEEAEKLRTTYGTPRALTAVGYREAIDFLDGKLPPGRKLVPGIQGLENEICLATRQLVKSQRTWFRGEKSSIWFTLERDSELLEAAWRRVYK